MGYGSKGLEKTRENAPCAALSCAAERIILPKRLGTFAAIRRVDPNPSEKRYREYKRTL